MQNTDLDSGLMNSPDIVCRHSAAWLLHSLVKHGACYKPQIKTHILKKKKRKKEEEKKT